MNIKNKSLKVNFIMNAILTMSSIMFPIITFPYISRILLPAGTGKVSFAISLVNYFTMFSQLGIPTYGVRACAAVRDDKEKLTRTAHELLMINLVMSGISYMVLGYSICMIPKLREEKTLYIIISFTIALSTLGLEWLYKALEQYTYIAIRSICFKFVALIAMFLLVHTREDYLIYGAISVFAASASNILNLINVHKYISLKPVGKYQFRKHMKSIMVFFAMSCATTIYTNLDTVMLGFMKTDMEVGYYNAAVKIKAVLVSVVTSLGVVILPRASYYIEHGLKDDFLKITKKAINFVILVATPMMVYFVFFAEEGIYLLSGNEYFEAISPMQILMPTLLLIGLTNIMGIQMLVPMGQEKIVLYSEIAGAIVNLVLNSILIPQLASIGAAIGTLAAEVVVWVVQYMSLKNIVKVAYQQIRYIHIMVAVLLASMSSVWIKALQLNVLVTLVLSTIMFFGVYVLVLTIFKEKLMLEMEKQILTKLRKL